MQPKLSRISAHILAAFIVLCDSTLGLAQETSPSRLQILVIGGEGSINNVKQRTAREPVVEVRDENNRPVAGAIVLFRAPSSGASGTFPNGSAMSSIATDQQGRAAARGFRPNSMEGDVELQVSASFSGLTATAVIHMRNAAGTAAVAGKSGVSGKVLAIVGAIGAAAATGIVLGTRGGSSPTTTAPPATTISLGAGTVGGR
jgi:hypothetical protein